MVTIIDETNLELLKKELVGCEILSVYFNPLLAPHWISIKLANGKKVTTLNIQNQQNLLVEITAAPDSSQSD